MSTNPFDLRGKRLTLDLNPCNQNLGIPGLTARALRYGIDLRKGEDAMIFVSRDRKRLKIVTSDPTGQFLIAKHLDHGGFQRILASIMSKGLQEISFQELAIFVEGGRIRVDPATC